MAGDAFAEAERADDFAEPGRDLAGAFVVRLCFAM
jgi:hypothetical protein